MQTPPLSGIFPKYLGYSGVMEYFTGGLPNVFGSFNPLEHGYFRFTSSMRSQKTEQVCELEQRRLTLIQLNVHIWLEVFIVRSPSKTMQLVVACAITEYQRLVL